MSKLKHIMQQFHDVIDSEYVTVIMTIMGNIFFIMGCCHYLGCLWFIVGNHEVPGYESWLETYNIEGHDWQYQYVSSVFWALTQFTPGSSKIQPGNVPETVVGFFVVLFGMVFFSVFISSITNQRMRLQALSSKVDRDEWILRRYLRQNGVSPGLTRRSIQFVEAAVTPLLRTVQRKDVALFSYLSRPLQLEVQAEMFCHTLLAHPFMTRLRRMNMAWTSELFPEIVTEITLAHTDLVFDVGQVSHDMYFVGRGKLVYLLRGNHKVEHVTANNWCCEPVLWVHWVHKGTAKAAEESFLIAVIAQKMRAAVLERMERSFIRICAKGYLNDINARIDAGLPVSDTIRITDDEESEYMTAINTTVRPSVRNPADMGPDTER